MRWWTEPGTSHRLDLERDACGLALSRLIPRFSRRQVCWFVRILGLYLIQLYYAPPTETIGQCYYLALSTSCDQPKWCPSSDVVDGR
jgi:hypothetical protein